MKVLVLGGTGAMGTYLVQLLSEKSIHTVVTSRRKRKAGKDNIEYVEGDAHDSDFLNNLLVAKWDAIVDFMVYSTTEFKERANSLLNATDQYIFISSARVYADCDHPTIESSPRLLDISKDNKYRETDEYALAKARQEDILSNSGRRNWTIIRPYITYSENRLQLGVFEKEEWLYRALHGRTIVFSKEILSKKTTMTHGLEVAKCIMSILADSKAKQEVFHVTTNECMKWNEVLEIYLNLLDNQIGYRPKVVLLELDEFIKCHPAKYQILYDRLYNRNFDNSKISNFIGENIFNQTEVGIKYCFEEFLESRRFININWRSEALKDKHTREHTPLKEIKGLKQKIKYLIFRYFIDGSYNH